MQSPTRSRKRLPMLMVMLATTLSLLVAACGSAPSSSTNTGDTSSPAKVTAPANLLVKGKLTIGSDTTYAPMEFIDTKANKPTGFDVDLVTEIAKRMGLEADVKTTSFTTIFDDLTNKRFDMVASSVTINDERKQKFDFVPYFRAGESLLVKKGNPKQIKGEDSLCGLKVGVQTGTVEQESLTETNKRCKAAGKSEIQTTVLQSQTDVINLLANGRVDATYQDSPITDYYNKLNPGQFEVAGSVVDAAPFGLMVRKGDTEMLKAVEEAFKSIKEDGTYDKIFEKWNLSADQKV